MKESRRGGERGREGQREEVGRKRVRSEGERGGRIEDLMFGHLLHISPVSSHPLHSDGSQQLVCHNGESQMTALNQIHE